MGLLEDNYATDIALSDEIKGYLSTTAKWAMFISIVGFLGVAMMVFAAIFMGAMLGAMSNSVDPSVQAMMPIPPIFLSIFYLIMALLMLVPMVYLFKFSTNTRAALSRNDDRALTDAFRNLKSHYKFYGIALALMLLFYAGLFLLGMFGALMGDVLGA